MFVLLLLGVCVTVDYADDNMAVTNDYNTGHSVKVQDTSKVIGLNDTGSVLTVKNSDKIYTIKGKKQKKAKKVKKQKPKKKKKKKPELPTISLWAKPSVRSGYSYKWHYRTWINYCPNCHHYNCLLVNPKGVPEKELTCGVCDSDFCGVTGKEKYSWSHVYLRSA